MFQGFVVLFEDIDYQGYIFISEFINNIKVVNLKIIKYNRVHETHRFRNSTKNT